jgi:hypothetical protein
MIAMEERNDEPHDVLAAEEHAIGGRDERYPDDPSGIEEPHDVLAAEEFAMPAGGDVEHDGDGGGVAPRALVLLLAALLAGLLILRARRS